MHPRKFVKEIRGKNKVFGGRFRKKKSLFANWKKEVVAFFEKVLILE
jgi:hypothetical protein